MTSSQTKPVVVRQVFDWVGRDRLTIGEVCRRLTQAGEVTRTGKRVWDRSVVWGILKNPAYMGTAAFGKTRQEPLRPRLRAQRRPASAAAAGRVDRVMSPRRSGTPSRCPRLWSPRWWRRSRSNCRRTSAMPGNRAAGRCICCKACCNASTVAMPSMGSASARVPAKASRARTPITAAWARMPTALEASGSVRIRQVRTDLLDLAVWQEVCTLLAHPERLAEEYRRRLQPETRAKRPSLATVGGQIGKLRQGVARLIDSYAEGLIDKGEFEPRITRLRQRLARLEEQRQALADEAALQAELQLIIGRLEDFATKLHGGLEAADWASQRDLIRALVKRVEVARDDVNIVFRVDPYPGDADPEKKSLQLCRGSALPCTGNHRHGADWKT